MKKMKRWLALVLAIALVSTNAIYQLGTHMSASESSQDTSVSEEQPQQEEQAADSQTQDTTEHTDSGQVSVQEVTPDQSATATTQQALMYSRQLMRSRQRQRRQMSQRQ